MLNIRTKIVLVVIIVLLGTIGASTMVNVYFFSNEMSSAYQSEAFVIGRTLNAQLDRLLRLKIPMEELIGFDEQCREIVDKYKHISYAMVVDRDGKILFHNNPLEQNSVITNPVILKGIQSREESIHAYFKESERYYDITIPVSNNMGKHVAAVKVGFPDSFISIRTRKLFFYSLFIAGFFSLLAIFLLVLSLSSWVTRPLTELLKVIHQVRKDGSQIHKRVKVSSADEIGQIGCAFNEMINDLAKYQDEIKTYAGELEKRIQERTLELEKAQRKLIDKAIEAGRAQFSAMVLHNIGNAMTPVMVRIEGIKSDELKKITGYMENCYRDLFKHKEELHRYVTDDARGKEVFLFMGNLVDMFKSHMGKTRKAVNDIERSVSYISDVLNLQQLYAARERENKESVDLNRVIEDALRMQEKALEEKGIVVRKDLAPFLQNLSIDRGRFIQVVVNLIKNSYEALDKIKDGIIEKSIIIRSFGEEKGIGFEITDNGMGISVEDIEKVIDFGRFSKDSTDLGLYYCKMFVEVNNGKIHIRSPVHGEGTTVRVIFKAENHISNVE